MDKFDAVGLIAIERSRQVAMEGWTPEHDDEHDHEELAQAAACYAWHATRVHPPLLWPWSPVWWKPTPNDRIRELVKAGALIVAEIERLQRGGAMTTPPVVPPEASQAPLSERLEDCPYCDGSGTMVDVEAGCCGQPTPSGECCGNAIPVQVLVQCQWCAERVALVEVPNV